ncbi:MAG: modification methylase [Nitrospirae bacterium RIFCSPHIGHO2_02_FULL_40_19]|nr:MAG: modification methylase [Nitrospirae bacterium RIFCSPHIGHO2_02_FULL_40_19]
MATSHKLIIGNCGELPELSDESVHLIVTSPPYFNAPFDYKNLFKGYNEFLILMEDFANESFRVLQSGRIAVVNVDDMLVDGEKFPIVADVIKIFQKAGFRYRDRIVWKKPDGYTRISRRSGVVLQNPYPMYFYPDNVQESIVIFQKGRFDYQSIPKEVRKRSMIDVKEFLTKKWFTTVWDIMNVRPGSELEKNIAAFPDELPYRCIKLFSYVGEIVLDPFVGSGTTMKVARQLKRNSIGIELKKELIPIVKKKLGFEGQTRLTEDKDGFQVIMRKNVQLKPQIKEK